MNFYSTSNLQDHFKDITQKDIHDFIEHIANTHAKITYENGDNIYRSYFKDIDEQTMKHVVHMNRLFPKLIPPINIDDTSNIYAFQVCIIINEILEGKLSDYICMETDVILKERPATKPEKETFPQYAERVNEFLNRTCKPKELMEEMNKHDSLRMFNKNMFGYSFNSKFFIFHLDKYNKLPNHSKPNIKCKNSVFTKKFADNFFFVFMHHIIVQFIYSSGLHLCHSHLMDGILRGRGVICIEPWGDNACFPLIYPNMPYIFKIFDINSSDYSEFLKKIWTSRSDYGSLYGDISDSESKERIAIISTQDSLSSLYWPHAYNNMEFNLSFLIKNGYNIYYRIFGIFIVGLIKRDYVLKLFNNLCNKSKHDE